MTSIGPAGLVPSPFLNPLFGQRGFFFRHSFFFPQPLICARLRGLLPDHYPDGTPGERLSREEGELAREERLREAEELRDQQRLRERESSKQTPVRDAPLTMLVFRDGHQLLIRNYAIVGRALWSFSEQRARKTLLSDLDLDATTKLNEERGVDFRLPPSPKGK